MNRFPIARSSFSSVFLASFLCMWATEKGSAEEMNTPENIHVVVESETSTHADESADNSGGAEESPTVEIKTLEGVLESDVSEVEEADVAYLEAQRAEIQNAITSYSEQMSDLASAELPADEHQRAVADLREKARSAIRNRIMIDRKLAEVRQHAEAKQTESDE